MKEWALNILDKFADWWEDNGVIVIILLVLLAFFAALIGIAQLSEYMGCTDGLATIHRNGEWRFWSGCFVEVSPGQLIPVSVWRVLTP